MFMATAEKADEGFGNWVTAKFEAQSVDKICKECLINY